MKKLICTLGILVGFAATANAGISPLTLKATPDQPFLITFGEGTTVSGWFKLAPGYFVINNIDISWDGDQTFQATAVTITSDDKTVNCSLAQEDLQKILPENVTMRSGKILIPAHTDVKSLALGCGSILLPSPVPSQFNIPVTVSIEGFIINENGSVIGRVESEDHIIIQ